MAMAVLQDQKQKQSSSCPPPPKIRVVSCSNANPNMPESRKRKRVTVAKSVYERAKEVEATLDPKFPILLKVMLPSHVAGCFWLGLSKKFCFDHMPKQDKTIVLEDENGDKFGTKYLAEKVGLSGGWRGFSIARKLREGDAVIFHLVTPSKFKVYIIRSNDLDGMDCNIDPLKLDASIKLADTGDVIACEREEREKLETIPKDTAIAFASKFGLISEHSGNDSEDRGFEVLDGLQLSESHVAFKEVKSMENFNVLVNGLNINSEFSKHLLTKYYDLCCSQNSFLHELLLEGLNCKLISGAISETINIADAIRSCSVTTLEGNFTTWYKTLKAFEGLGMNVGFLHARLNQLVSLASRSKRFKEARLERDRAEEEMRSLEAKLLVVKDAINMLDSEIESLNTSLEKLEHMFQEVAKAPW
ncbi:B3 domain-containing protein Os01g0234100-like isoform X2 [Pyrus x bretschneideri]|uniref:B3 domain-containing protein Os01g0234100-like isoform X2 n=1 Tax=Pyrus x bretschneideri TaxID=225117 RepID=UPI0020303FBB|nr:B3 domain-containing protein Os01g0234100-like isoform X2 [Pyrus x bretschneideri]